MLGDPVIWLFLLSVGLLALGVGGVVVATLRARRRERPGEAGPGSELARVHALRAEVDRLRTERDEERAMLSRLSALLEQAEGSVSRISRPRPSGVSGHAGSTNSGREAHMSDKGTLLRDADAAFTELRGAVEGLSDEEMQRVWLGRWGVREILIHISGWHEEMIPVLGRVAKGAAGYPAGTYDDFDAWNARFVDRKTGVKCADVLAELEASHRAFLAAAASVPESHFEPGGTAREPLEGAGAAHYREHAAQIRQWRRP
jgi:Protein of unknown function (DUF1706)